MDGGQRSSIPHIAALDGARGAAVAGVLLFHGGHLRGGYLGVDLFFTLSGFLITSLLLAESTRTGSVGLGGFWARRARRLLPALALLIVGVVVYCLLVATPQELTQIRGDAFATLAYSANWRAAFSHKDYFSLFAAPSPLSHTWSLAIEEQFYVIWPLVFVALLARFKQATPRAVLVTSLVLAGASSALMIGLYRPGATTRLYYGTDTRAAAILLGAALAAWLAIHGPTRDRRRRVALEAAGVLGVTVLAVAWTHLGGDSSRLYRGGFLVCGLAATAVIAAIVHPDRQLLARLLSWKPLCQLGLISYGVYLFHWPIDIVVDQQRVGLGGWPLFIVQTVIALSIAIASYRFVEQPMRRGAIPASQWRRLVPALATVLVVAVVAGTLQAKPPPSAAAVSHPLLAATRAYQRAAPGSRRIMFVGNSMAWFLAAAMPALHATPPFAVDNDSVLGCVFPPQVEVRSRPVTENGVVARVTIAPCDAASEAGAIARFRPNVVVWLYSDAMEYGGSYHGKQARPCTEPYDSLFQKALEAEIAKLGAGGAKVVVTNTAYRRTDGVARQDRSYDCENRVVRAVAAKTGTQLVDLFRHVCPSGHCLTRLDGAILRPDGLHYDGTGAVVIDRWLISQIGLR